MSSPLISICIPAYKRVDSLKHLLESIKSQSFTDFEVIVTDDSPDDAVQNLCFLYKDFLPLQYFKNTQPLGTPENWNEAIRHANGRWIKLMHDDDWFLSPDSLRIFADFAVNAEGKIIFSAFKNIRNHDEVGELITLTFFREFILKLNPVSLLSKNCIGPPSVTLFERLPALEFDKNLKWLVDMEFYIRLLNQRKIVYINNPLVGIGIHATQVTASSSLNPAVEIPEHLYLLKKLGVQALNNIPFYDAYWRLFRNLGIRELSSIKSFVPDLQIPENLATMIRMQKKAPLWLLKFGVFSKLLMLLCYFSTRFFT